MGDLEINPTPTRIYDTIEQIWGVCSELIKRKGLNGRLKIQKDIPQVLNLDHYRLTQILLNLVGNSVKFTDRGRINISMEWISHTDMVEESCFEPRPFDEDDQSEGIYEKNQAVSILSSNDIELSFSANKIKKNFLPSRLNLTETRGVLKIIVSDTGLGMSRDDLQRLFQKFVQVTGDAARKKLGTGLGLFITKELCTRMNGKIKAFSKVNQGSVFTLCIPADPVFQEVSSLLDMDSIRNTIKMRQPKALVVDDQPFSSNVLKNFLSRLNVEVGGYS